MKVRFHDINWDTTDDEFPEGRSDADLPAETILEVADDINLREDGADVLSDQFGYCVNGYQFEIVG